MITIEYRCADGTPFPVRFATKEDAELPWGFDRLHGRDPMTPLADALGRLGVPGCERAYEEVGMRPPSMWRAGPDAFGFPYFCQAPMSDEELGQLFEGCGRLLEQYGSAEGIWRDRSLPKVVASCDWLEQADPTAPLTRLAEEADYALHLTMIPAYVSGNDLQLMARICNDLYGDRGEMVAYELTQGYPNETLQADHDLWRLGRMINESSRLRDALASGDPRAGFAVVRAAGEEAPFFGALERFLDRYGRRGEAWDIALPTWREQGAGFWAQLRNMAGREVVAPEEARVKAVERREALTAEIDARLAGDREQQARFHRRVGRLASYVAVREERAHWQLVVSGSLRTAVLRRGGLLVEQGVVERAEGVLYLLPEECEAPSGDLRLRVEQRRAEHESWKRVTPPAFIGGIRDDAEPPAGGPRAHGDGVVRGIAASRGSATGRARVVVDLADAGRVEPGDVLVCVMTAPPWTPLFAVAGAVVVDYGDRGSHAAIAAREYGIPCVVGTKVGTTLIPDGAIVTVDGAEGTVAVSVS